MCQLSQRDWQSVLAGSVLGPILMGPHKIVSNVASFLREEKRDPTLSFKNRDGKEDAELMTWFQDVVCFGLPWISRGVNTYT